MRLLSKKTASVDGGARTYVGFPAEGAGIGAIGGHLNQLWTLVESG